MSLFDFLIIAMSATLVLTLVLMVFAFKKKNDMGRSMGVTLLACCTCTGAYMISLYLHGAQIYAFFQGIYFSSITLILLALLRFTMLYTKDFENKIANTGWRILHYVCIADVLFEATNFLHHLCLTYTAIERPLNHFVYVMGFGFQTHLILCYIMLGLVAFLLIRRFFIAPRFYWRRYEPALATLVIVVAVNAVYLFAPESNNLKMIDYSLLGYSIGALCFYWMAFRYSKHGLASHYQSWVVSSYDLGILLFDMYGNLILHNERAQQYLRNLQLNDELKLDQFLKGAGLIKTLDIDKPSGTTQFYRLNHSGASVPMRCEYKAMVGANHKISARLFSISSMVNEIDPLTGFMTWEHFLTIQGATVDPGHLENSQCVLCDINGLSVINEKQGRAIGDLSIQKLASLMRSCFPEDAFFVRYKDAHLAVFCYGLSDTDCHDRMEKVRWTLQEDPYQYGFSIQSAVQRITVGSPADAIEIAMRIIRIKKLMDRTSNHSDTLNSIIQILQECDDDTMNHIRRTQAMSIHLGRKLGLTDDQLSHLSLLAILHDIGKVGVPMEILNKPGKLTKAEWHAIQSHTEKGARIVQSSGELADISDMIRHHHERWDGQGYPSGLSKESIPLLSRVISVVDSYDAMVYNRSYRKCLTREKAMNELLRGAGTQFDPNIVSVFLEMLHDDPVEGDPNAQPFTGKHYITDEWTWHDAKVPEEEKNVFPIKLASYILNQSSVIESVNSTFTELTGYTLQEAQELQLTQRDLIPVEDWDDFAANFSDLINTNDTVLIEHRLLKKDGSVHHVLSHARNFFDSATRTHKVQFCITKAEETHIVQKLQEIDLTNRAVQSAHWEMMYRKDPLTGLLSRNAFRNDVEHALIANESRQMMIMMDMDHFKQVNDQLGHRTGDEFLILLGKTLGGLIKPGELLSRMGGDEFAALLSFPAGASNEDMIQRGKEISDELNMVISSHSQGISGVSCGGVVANQNAMVFDALYEMADEALYLAKHRGRGCFCMYEEKKQE